MRTRISLSDALLAKAKRRAEEENVTLNELVEAAVKDHLTRPSAPKPIAPFRLITFGSGGLASELSYDRLKETVEEEDGSRFAPGRLAPGKT